MADDIDGNATDNGADDKAKDTPQAVPYARFKEVVEARKAAEAALEAVVTELTMDVPETYRVLIPASLPAAERAAWIRNARAKGLFTPPAPANSPDSKRPTGKQQTDISTMNASQKLRMAFGKK